MGKRVRGRGEEGNGMRKREKSMSPVGTTCDLQLVRQATVNIGRYWKDLKERKSKN